MARLVYIPDPAPASDSSGSFTVRFPTSSTGSATVQIVGTLRVYADDFGSITIPGVASGSHTWVKGGPRGGAAPGDSDWSVFPFGPTSVPSGGSVTATWEYHNNGSWGRLDYELDISEYRPEPGPSSTPEPGPSSAPEPEPSSGGGGDSSSGRGSSGGGGGGSSGGGGGGSSGDTSSGYSPSGASSLSSVGSLSSVAPSSSITWTESSSVSSSFLWGSESSPGGSSSSSSSEISPEGPSSGWPAESSSLFSSSQSSSIFSSSSSSLWDSSSSSSSSVSSSSGCQCLSKGDGHYSESTLATSGGKLVLNCFGCLELWTECGWGICDLDEWKTSGQDS